MKRKDPAMEEFSQGITLLVAIAWELVWLTVIGLGLGYLCWTKLGFPWEIMAVFSLFGFGAGIYRIYLMTEGKKKKNQSGTIQ